MADLTLEELADRVEKLNGPDRIVDELILLATGWTLKRAEGLGERASWIDPSGAPTAHRQGDGWFKPTASIDAAMTLVPEGYDWIVGHTNGGLTIHAEVGNREQIFGDTPALALCAAALRARANLSTQRGGVE